MLFVTHESDEFLKLPVRFLFFTNLQTMISIYILFRKYLGVPFFVDLIPGLKLPILATYYLVRLYIDFGNL